MYMLSSVIKQRGSVAEWLGHGTGNPDLGFLCFYAYDSTSEVESQGRFPKHTSSFRGFPSGVILIPAMEG